MSPGFGIAGIAGIALILGSFVFSLQDFYWPEFDWQWTIARRNFGIVGIGLFGGIVVIGVIMAALPRAGLFDRLVLHGPGDPDYAGFSRRRRQKKSAGDPLESISSPVEDTGTSVAIGAVGVAVTDLRPVGKVRFENRVSVTETDGEYYKKGTQVVVLRFDGVKIVVVAVEDS